MGIIYENTCKRTFHGSHKQSQRVTNRHKFAPGPNASAFWWYIEVTKSHQAPMTAHPGGHKRVRNRTRAQRHSAFWWSQLVTESHQALIPARHGGHNWSQNRTRPQCQRILAVTSTRKVAPSVTNVYQAPTPAHPGGNKVSQNRAKPQC